METSHVNCKSKNCMSNRNWKPKPKKYTTKDLVYNVTLSKHMNGTCRMNCKYCVSNDFGRKAIKYYPTPFGEPT
jgi:sulfatase maturation enzyme AslB (radical SAM superfamily)